MYRLTIIVPFVGQSEPFEATLVSILENRPNGCELIVVNDGVYDDPYGISDEVEFAEVPTGTSLLGRLNRGSELARGDLLHFVLPGLTVGADWTSEAVASFDEPRVASVSPAIHGNGPRSAILAGVAYHSGGSRHVESLRPRDLRRPSKRWDRIVAPTMLAGFYRRSYFELCGGFDESIGERNADVDLGLTLGSFGLHCVFQPGAELVLSTNVITPHSPFAAGVSDERLYRRHADPKSLPRFRHWSTMLWDVASSWPHQSVAKLAGRASVAMKGDQDADYRRHLVESQKVADFLVAQAERRRENLDSDDRSYRRAA